MTGVDSTASTRLGVTGYSICIDIVVRTPNPNRQLLHSINLNSVLPQIFSHMTGQQPAQ